MRLQTKLLLGLLAIVFLFAMVSQYKLLLFSNIILGVIIGVAIGVPIGGSRMKASINRAQRSDK